MKDGSIVYYLPEISVIPPIDTEMCQVTLYYNGNVLVNTFYIFSDQQPSSEFNNWMIEGHKKIGKGSSLGIKQNTYMRYDNDQYFIFYNATLIGNNTYDKPIGKIKLIQKL